MVRKVKMPKGGELWMYEKGEGGRPRRKPITHAKLDYYEHEQINVTIKSLLVLTYDELELVYRSPVCSVLEKLIASALQCSIREGSLANMDMLLTRAFGKPSQTVEIRTVKKRPLSAAPGDRAHDPIKAAGIYQKIMTST